MTASVDILMACYNAEKYVDRAIESVLNQQTRFRFRLLVIDDCSSDRSADMLLKKAEQEPNLVVYISSKNCGGTVTFCKLLSLVSSDYVMFLEADDRWFSTDVVETLVGHLEKTGSHSVTSNHIVEGQQHHAPLKERTISFHKFACGCRFPMTGTAIRVNEKLLKHWGKSIPGVTLHQADLTVCLSIVAESPIKQLPIVSLVYNERNGEMESNYNSLTTLSQKISDRMKIVVHNLQYYWNRPSYFILLFRTGIRYVLLPVYDGKLRSQVFAIFKWHRSK